MTAVSVRREGVGSPSPRTTWIGLPCIRRAEQDWQDARSERPAMGTGSPEQHNVQSPSLTRLGFLTEQASGEMARAAPSLVND